MQSLSTQTVNFDSKGRVVAQRRRGRKLTMAKAQFILVVGMLLGIVVILGQM